MRPYNEADTRAKLIDPLLRESRWSEDRIEREKYYTPGRIFTIGDEAHQREGRKVDYLLYHRIPDIPLAVVEAKDESRAPGDGMQQAKRYAEEMGLLFAYSTNGHGIEEFDFTTHQQQLLNGFPSPDDLYARYISHRQSRGHRVLSTEDGEITDPLLHPYYLMPGKQPRYYQDLAVRRVIESILDKRQRVLLTMATGTGKTYVAFQIAWKLVRAGYLRRVLFLADRVVLRNQAYNTFGPFGDARYIVEGMPNLNRDIYFGIYQGLYSGDDAHRVFQDFPSDFFDLVIIDECHRSGFGTWRAILDHFGEAVHFGMTATPKRDDNIDTYDYFGEPVYTYSLGQGIEDGFLATYRVHRVKTNVDRTGLHLRDAAAQGAEVFIPEDVEPREVYLTQQFEREITLPDRVEIMVADLAEKLRTFGSMQRTMVFCVNMDHARDVARELQNHLGPETGLNNYAVRIVSEEPDARALLEQFADSERPAPVVATTADLLTTGVDVPSARNIVFMKTVASPIVFKQIVGRGSRLDKLTDKYWFRVIDYTNATRLFDEWDRPPGEPPEVHAGPRDKYLQGVVIHAQLETPVADASVIAMLSPNEQMQVRTDEHGLFSFADLPDGEVKLIVNKHGFRKRQMTVTTMETPDEDVVVELKPIAKAKEPIRVKGINVYVAEETYLEIDATGERLTVQQYVEYIGDTVRQAVPTWQDLRQAWIQRETRESLQAALEQKGIYLDALTTAMQRPDVDEFDLLASAAFGVTPRSRDERAKALANLDEAFLNAYGPDARVVLETLVDKYRLGGLSDLSDPRIFDVPPFTRMGHLPGVAQRFGGVDKLREAIVELQARLYPLEMAA